MSEENKYRKPGFSDFLRYSGNKMTDKEKNEFERKLQKDAFAEEVAEGFEMIKSGEVEKDIASLHKRLIARTARKQRFVLYRIAASIAVLMVISSIFIIVRRNRPLKQLSDATIHVKEMEIAESKPLSKPPEVTQKTDVIPVISERKPVKSGTRQESQERIEKSVVMEKEKLARGVVTDTTKAYQTDKAGRQVTYDQMAAPVAVLVKSERPAEFRIKGKVISSEDNLPVPGASVIIKGTPTGVVTDSGGNFNIILPDSGSRIIVAGFIGLKSKEMQVKGDSAIQVRLDPAVSSLSEVVVIGYGTGRAETEEVEQISDYFPPQPATGRSNFNKYIEDNLQRPDPSTAGQRVVVVVSFMVHNNGNVDSIRIVRSPGKLFSDEAIRLINEGPAWKPAEQNGKTIDDEVRIRIVFK